MAAWTQTRWRGYAEIAGSAAILGTSGALLQLSTMPAALLLVVRMVLAGVVLAALLAWRGGYAEIRQSRQLGRLVLIGVVVAGELLCFVGAVRLANVAIGISLEYMAPVYVALVAPWVLHTRRRWTDMLAVAIAAAGMALIVVPSLSLTGADSVLPGIACGVVAGGLFATALMLVKSLRPCLHGDTVTLFHCIAVVVLLSPLAAVQMSGSHYHLTLQDAWIALVFAFVYTAFCFSVQIDGMRFVRVEHAGILGYIEPVTAPFWALLLVGERPGPTTLAGAALILAAGMSAMLLSEAEEDLGTLAVARPPADAEAAEGGAS